MSCQILIFVLLGVKKAARVKNKPVKEAESVTTEKEHVNIVFIGHVDAGKSTIGGQLMYLTNMVDKRTLEKYEKEAKDKNRETWYLSWCMDTNQEERDKGKTERWDAPTSRQRRSISRFSTLPATSPTCPT